MTHFVCFSRRRLVASALAAATLASTSGCGFRLRGSFHTPFETMYLDVNRHSPFGARLERQLKSGANVRIVSDVSEAQAILKVIERNLERNIVSYNADGNAREYELKLTVRFSLTSPAGLEFLPVSVITARREVSYSDEDYLSRESEEAIIVNEMHADVVSQMIRRIEKAELPKSSAPAESATTVSNVP